MLSCLLRLLGQLMRYSWKFYISGEDSLLWGSGCIRTLLCTGSCHSECIAHSRMRPNGKGQQRSLRKLFQSFMYLQKRLDQIPSIAFDDKRLCKRYDVVLNLKVESNQTNSQAVARKSILSYPYPSSAFQALCCFPVLPCYAIIQPVNECKVYPNLDLKENIRKLYKIRNTSIVQFVFIFVFVPQ